MTKVLRNKQIPLHHQRLVHRSPLLHDVAQSDTAQTLRLLHATFLGLTECEAASRLEHVGYNEVAYERPQPWPMQLVATFVNPFILVLVVLGLVSLATDVVLVPVGARNWTKVLILSVMILVSCLLRFWQEFRSQQAVQRLKALVQTTATVLRRTDASTEPARRDIKLSELVPGDLVFLSAGDMIPADVRLLSSRDLFVSQSLLTGEAMPVEKADTETLSEESTSASSSNNGNDLLEKPQLCFMGTNVVSGTATAVVVATGHETFLSTVAESVLGRRSTTSFDKGVNQVSWVLIRFMMIMVPVVFLLNGLAKGDWKEALFFGLAVAVGLTPEMLPLVVTTTLAKGAMKMARQHVIVKRLPAIQNLGAIDVLCTDKTGTLTQNHVTLVRHLDAQGETNERVLHLAVLNSTYQSGLKNLLDQAIMDHAQQEHRHEAHPRYHKIDELPFDFLRRRMSVIVQQESEPPLLICKGALEEILQVCRDVEDQGQISSLTEVVQTRIERLGRELQEEGFRIIAVAYKRLPYLYWQYSVADEQDLVFAGFIGFLDPPKTSARETIEALATHGVAVKVLTGDNEVVTARICEEVGLDATRTVLGCEIEGMSDEELAQIAEQTSVFAKVDPLQKARILRAIKSRGHTVGYIGDGINDAAALREADVGISVDTAVDIAKESADIILLEKSLLVLEQGIIEGRVVFGNIMKYLKMTISSNFGNVLSVLIASACLPFLPMLPLQLLVQNLLYDLSQLALPWDSIDQEFLAQPRQWEAGRLIRFVLCLGPVSSIFDITTFLALWFVFQANAAATQSLFQSGWFVEGLLSQTLIVHLIRTQKIPFIQRTASLPVLVLTGSVMLVGMLIPFTPFGTAIGLRALPLTYLPWLIATLLTYCALTQLVKSWYLKRFKVWL
jgi:Mg2+-importing ATPase